MGGEAAESGVGVGSIVAGTYEIVRVLGRGGMGAVWEAHHSRLPGKRVAIKVLHASVADDPEALARFRREAEIACRLGHPNIVEVHDFNKLDDGSPYLILELLEGESLDDRLRKGALSIEDCEAYMRQIASALQCAHAQGVIHRDLKPQNIFLVPSPTGVGPDIVKVLDFGISKIRGSQTVQTQDSTLLGTPQYMAPEQAVGQHDKADARTDIFALGAMLYELLSGQPAFGGQNIPEVVYKVVHVEEAPLTALVTDIPPDKAAAIHKALSKAQDDRFATVDEFVLAFTGAPLAALRATGTARVARVDNEMLASAATVDSSKIEMAKAATVASHSSEMPAMTGAYASQGDAKLGDANLGAAATIASGNSSRIGRPHRCAAGAATRCRVATAKPPTAHSHRTGAAGCRGHGLCLDARQRRHDAKRCSSADARCRQPHRDDDTDLRRLDARCRARRCRRPRCRRPGCRQNGSQAPAHARGATDRRGGSHRSGQTPPGGPIRISRRVAATKPLPSHALPIAYIPQLAATCCRRPRSAARATFRPLTAPSAKFQPPGNGPLAQPAKRSLGSQAPATGTRAYLRLSSAPSRCATLESQLPPPLSS